MDLKVYLQFFMRRPKHLWTRNVKSVFEIDYDALSERGVKMLLFDVDDTLSGYHDAVPKASVELLENLGKRFSIALLSNCPPERKGQLAGLVEHLPISVGMEQSKPDPRPYISLLKKHKIEPRHAAMIGDRPGTDLWGAMLAGIEERILVEPYSSIHGAKKASLFYRALRGMERRLSNI